MAVFTGNGAAGTPSFTFSSDTNLGIFRAGDDILSITTGGTERARFNADGNLEVGGTLGSAPNCQLRANGQVKATSSAVVTEFIRTTAANNGNTHSIMRSAADGSNIVAQIQCDGTHHFGGDDTNSSAVVMGDGSAYFAGQVDVGGTKASPNIELQTAGNGIFGNGVRCVTFRAQREDNLLTPILGAFATTNGAATNEKCVVRGDGLYIGTNIGDAAGVSPTDANIALNSSGFITTETTEGHVNINVTNGALLVSPDGISENATMQIMHDGTVEVGGQINSASPAPNISLDPDGSAYFAGQVDIGGTSASPNAQILEDGNIIAGNDPNNGGANGVRMRPNGFIECTNGNTGNVFQGYNSAVGNTKTSTIHATGFATFGNTDEPITAQQGVRAFMDTASGSNVAGFACENQGTGPTFKGSTGSDAADITFIVSSGGTISAVSTTITALSSERRLKENIVPIDAETAWSTIKEVPYYTYNFISNPEEVCYGPIADEVPEEMRIATERSDEVGTIHTYDNGMLQARLYTALQTALTRIEALEAEVAALKGA